MDEEEEGSRATGVRSEMKRVVISGLAAAERRIRRNALWPLSEARNFLLMQYPTALGPAVHATPMVAALRAALPECRIAVAASGMALELFANNPAMDWLIETPTPLREWAACIRSLRRQMPFGGENFVALTLAGNERTRIATAGWLSGASAQVGFSEAPEIYRVALEYDSKRSLIDNNLRIAEAFGLPFRHFEPQVFFGEGELAWARERLAEAGVREGQMVVAFVTQTSVTQRKSWRAERFQAAARHMIARHGAKIVFVGTAVEAAAIDALIRGIGGSYAEAMTNVAGKTSLLQLSALLSLCRVGLTLDTGPLHLGRAVGVPMAIVAPAWSPPIEWLPVGDPRYRILKNAEMADATPEYVIDEVSVDEVTRALDDLVAQYPAGAAADLRG
jgi:ADP-heptose:LPS heptosyltransferase